MEPHQFLILGGVLLFASASFFFALAESCLFALGLWRARQLAEQHPKRGAIVIGLLEKPSELLATISLGNSLANGCIVVLLLLPALNEDWPLRSTLLAAFLLILIGCEVVPKTLGMRAPDRWALRVAPGIRLVQSGSGWFQSVIHHFNAWLLKTFVGNPFARSHSSLGEEEYRELLDLAHHQGMLGHAEKEIMLKIISLDRRTAQDVMKPLSRMHMISDDLTVAEMVFVARQFKHRRLPIYDETPDTIVGVLNTQALLLDPDIPLEEAIEFPSFVPESMNLLQLFNSLQKQKRGLAIVLDEYGGTAGLVTISDILEALIGEIRDEGEPSGFVMEKLEPGRWRINGTMLIEDFRREHAGLGPTPDVDTMGGLVVSLMEIVPAAGQSVRLGNLRLTAQVVESRRVREVLVEVAGKKKRSTAL